ncbi:hypothetical protein MIN45_P1309 [Methylomarinovum tepidoasis]|uniref:DUF2281 domain-containing protein n=1 Tax=Methylomarinovum tepidoasis TaxID=2840183 RepID=A0AAU9C6U4_9GAMM|nr:DUF2281 domain-containing protein [Methylomarinovum sp. IN45]BCX88939.1 hypothetical protein MIN45_P1309 [Methylomarinovum sp. IN45]
MRELEKIIELIAQLPPDKQEEVADFVEFLSKKQAHRPPPSTPLVNEALFGLWKAREDMKDSVEYVRRLREKEWGPET